jgi:hypothetical protein
VGEALLPRDPPDDDDGRPGRVDAVTLEHVGAEIGPVLSASMPL